MPRWELPYKFRRPVSGQNVSGDCLAGLVLFRQVRLDCDEQRENQPGVDREGEQRVFARAALSQWTQPCEHIR